MQRRLTWVNRARATGRGCWAVQNDRLASTNGISKTAGSEFHGQISLQLIAVWSCLISTRFLFFLKAFWKHSKKYFYRGKFQTHTNVEGRV